MALCKRIVYYLDWIRALWIRPPFHIPHVLLGLAGHGLRIRAKVRREKKQKKVKKEYVFYLLSRPPYINAVS